MKETQRFTKALLKPINTAAIILLGTYTVVWGFWLANPWWHVFNRAPLYRKMTSAFDWFTMMTGLSSEFAWGAIAIIAGLVTCYGAYRPSYHALTTGAAVAFLHWAVIAMFYFWGDWQNTGGITSMTFAIYAAFVYLNIRVNHRNGGKEMAEMFS